jgi:hypothetical protein
MAKAYPEEYREKAWNLHVNGLKDKEISKDLGISKECVSSWLNGRRIRTHKPTRIHLPNGNCVCTICGKEKEEILFPTPRYNGKSKTLSEISFCKDCLAKKSEIVRRGTLEKYLRYRGYSLKVKCKREGIPYNIEEGQLLDLHTNQKGKCFYTDEEMIIPEGREPSSLRQAISVDRVIPEKGYIIENIVLCTYKANAVKQDLTIKEIHDWLPNWYERLVKRFPEKINEIR